MVVESLLARIRGEYREMPGLRLTTVQARRLWHVDEPTCTQVLHALQMEGFLRRLSDGAYVAAGNGDTTLRTAKATLDSVPAREHRRAV